MDFKTGRQVISGSLKYSFDHIANRIQRNHLSRTVLQLEMIRKSTGNNGQDLFIGKIINASISFNMKAQRQMFKERITNT